MNEPQRYRLATFIVLAQIALVALAILVLIGMILLFPIAGEEVAQAPEFAYLEIPFLLAGLAIGICVEVAIVVTFILAELTRGERIFSKTALRLVDVLVIAPSAATVIVAAVIPAIPGPPFLFYVLLVAVVGGIALVFVLLVLRSLLRRSAVMHTELVEVV